MELDCVDSESEIIKNPSLLTKCMQKLGQSIISFGGNEKKKDGEMENYTLVLHLQSEEDLSFMIKVLYHWDRKMDRKKGEKEKPKTI